MSIHNYEHNQFHNIGVEIEVEYLRIILSNNTLDREKLNFKCRLNTEKTLDHWLARDLLYPFLVTLSLLNLMVSRMVYLCYHLYTSPVAIKSTNSSAFNFIWKNKTHYIRKTAGLKAIDLE